MVILIRIKQTDLHVPAFYEEKSQVLCFGNPQCHLWARRHAKHKYEVILRYKGGTPYLSSEHHLSSPFAATKVVARQSGDQEKEGQLVRKRRRAVR